MHPALTVQHIYRKHLDNRNVSVSFQEKISPRNFFRIGIRLSLIFKVSFINSTLMKCQQQGDNPKRLNEGPDGLKWLAKTVRYEYQVAFLSPVAVFETKYSRVPGRFPSAAIFFLFLRKTLHSFRQRWHPTYTVLRPAWPTSRMKIRS